MLSQTSQMIFLGVGVCLLRDSTSSTIRSVGRVTIGPFVTRIQMHLDYFLFYYQV